MMYNSDLFEAMGLERVEPLPEWRTVGSDQFFREYANRKAVHLFKSPQGYWNARYGTLGYSEPEGLLIEPCRKLSTALRRIHKATTDMGWGKQLCMRCGGKGTEPYGDPCDCDGGYI